MKAVIMAGGKGTRLSEYTKDVPKPMLKIHGKPVLDYQINLLGKYGVAEITIVIGYLGDRIMKYFGNGASFGVKISYIVEENPLGTAGALYYLKDMVPDDFMLIFGDIFFDIDITRFINFHRYKNAVASLFLHPNSHPYDSDLVILDAQSKVVGFDSKSNQRDYFYKNCVNSGLYVLNRQVFKDLKSPEKLDLEKDVITKLIENNRGVYGYQSCEYVKDMGTPDRLKRVIIDYNLGITKGKNLSRKQKCIFIDRDGTINKYKGLLYQLEEFELEEYVAEAIKKINSSVFLCIIITNQPVVARNLCSIQDLEEIHKKMETLLGQKGAYLDDILFCPHHPDRGYEGENKDYKRECNCRKPKTGMIDLCVTKYNIDLSQSYFIGDTTLDVMTGKNAGLKTILLKTGKAGTDNRYQIRPDYIYDNLDQAVTDILEESKDD